MTFRKIEFGKHKLALVALAATAVAVMVAGLCPLLTTDTCCRSAPMAEAFAAGEWFRAFHPRFGLGLPVLAGSLRFVTGLDGYTACSVVAMATWALTIIPLFYLTRHLFDECAAWFAIVLFLAAPMFTIWGLMGLREPYKAFGIVLMADSIFRCRGGGWRNFAEAVAGLAFLLYFKVDGIAFGCFLTCVYMCVDGFRTRSWVLLATLLLLLQPCCLLVYDWTGMWIPAPQLGAFLNPSCGG